MERTQSWSSLTSALAQHRWIIFGILASSLFGAAAFLLLTPPTYLATARIIVSDDDIGVSELGEALADRNTDIPGEADPIATQAELVLSQGVLRRAIDRVFPPGLSNSSETFFPTVEEIIDALYVGIVPATNILELEYVDSDPEIAARLLNEIVDSAVNQNISDIRSEATSIRRFLETQIDSVKARLSQLQASEAQYLLQTSSLSFETLAQNLQDKLNSLEEQEREILDELQLLATGEPSLQQSGSGSSFSELSDLRMKLAELEAEVAESKTRFTSRYPQQIALVQQLEEVRELYTQERLQFMSVLTAKLENVRAVESRIQQRLTQLPLQQQKLSEFTRQREEVEASLERLQRKLEEAKIAEVQSNGNIRIIGRAEIPLKPESPQPAVAFTISIFAGLALAAGVVSLLKVTDDTLLDTAELKSLVDLPILGVLPKLAKSPSLLHQPEIFASNFQLFEPYRSLLKSLEFRSRNNLKVIVISSSIKAEGKSLVASHLAVVSAILSRKTLVIDADLRRPQQHSLFNLMSQQVGVTEFINDFSGDEMSFLSVIQRTDIDNLSVMTSGESHTQPSVLLESPNLENLFEFASHYFDLVIVDAPPIADCADAVTLAKYSDGLVLIARPNLTPRETLIQSIADISSSGIPILGIVSNASRILSGSSVYHSVNDLRLLPSSHVEESSYINASENRTEKGKTDLGINV